MGIRTYKPTSNGRRNSMVSDFKEITDRKKKPEKKTRGRRIGPTEVLRLGQAGSGNDAEVEGKAQPR